MDMFYFTDDQRGLDPLQVAYTLPSGTGIIFRHYNCENRAEKAEYLAKICKHHHLNLYIAQNPALAHSIDADGVHLPEYQISRIPMIRSRYPALDISAACHSARALHKAAALGADRAFLSPIFPTKSHPGKTGTGLMTAALAIRGQALPVYALGGVQDHHVRQLAGLGFSGFGAISYFEDRIEKLPPNNQAANSQTSSSNPHLAGQCG